jgi:hypothetical protein
MTGSLLQLVAYGNENQYLNGNPQLSFFKMVYRRYTNFAMQSIEVNFESFTKLSYDKPTIVKLRIPRNADLFSNMFFTFDLPDIFADSNNIFQWIPRIGTTIINSAKIFIGGQLIEELFGDYIDIVHELKMSTDKNNCYNDLIANTPEYYNPIVEDNRYPKSTTNKFQTINSEYYVNRGYITKPTIQGKKLFVPLPFWFHRHFGLAVPLIALQYHEVVIELELRPIRDLYLVGKPYIVDMSDSFYKAQVGGIPAYVEINNSFTRYKWSRPTELVDEIKHFTKLNDNSWNINPALEINYIFLDEDERKTFASNTHQYLIEKVSKYSMDGNYGNQIIQLQTYHPVKELYITAKRDDIKKRNQWTNYTNLDWEDMKVFDYQSYYLKLAKKINPSNPISPLGIFRTDNLRTTDIWLYNSMETDICGNYYLQARNLIDPTKNSLFVPFEDAYTNQSIFNLVDNWRFRDLSDIPIIDLDNYKDYDERIIKNIQIKFNGNIRLDSKPYEYYNKIQPFIHHSNIPRKGILTYSFAVEPDKYQPSGSCNFSHIQTLEFDIEFKNPIVYEKSDNYKNVLYDLDIYFVSYNILQIMGGLGGLVFGN